MESNNSNAFYVVKAFAILSVIFAHCIYQSEVVQSVTDLIGMIGVPIFLISSAVFFNADESNKLFWTKKLKRIVIPWIIFGVFTYLISVILNGSFGLKELFFWCIGYGSWLYFVTILLIYSIIFKYIKWKVFPYLMIIVWLVSVVLEFYGINPLSNLVGPYLNFFSRIGYFAVGVILKKYNVMNFVSPKPWIKLASTLVSICLGVLATLLHQRSIVFIIQHLFVLSMCVTLFLCAQTLCECKLLQNIGKQTYLIYFLHMQLGIGTSNIILNLLPEFPAKEAIVLVLKPILVLTLVYVGIFILLKIVRFLKLEKYKWIVGLK